MDLSLSTICFLNYCKISCHFYYFLLTKIVSSNVMSYVNQLISRVQACASRSPLTTVLLSMVLS